MKDLRTGRIRWWLKAAYQLRVIRKSGIFDPDYYLAQQREPGSVRRALVHYVLNGARHTGDPSPYFDTEYYLRQRAYIADVVHTFNITPLYHYLRFGLAESLNPCAQFDTRFYYCTNPDVQRSGMAPLFHFVRFGQAEGRRGAPDPLLPSWSWDCPAADRMGSRWARRARQRAAATGDYMAWRKIHEPSPNELKAQRKATFPSMPIVSVVVPVFRPDTRHLGEMIDSVARQTYANWQLCISASQVGDATARFLHRLGAKDSRIATVVTDEPLGISENSNRAISISRGEWIAFLDQDDCLAPNALHEVVRYVNEHPETQIVYSDEDKISANSRRYSEPFFKPDWSPDTFMSHNYTCHLSVYAAQMVRDLGGLRSEFDGSQDYDLMLRASERSSCIGHIPRVLYHWRVHAGSAAGESQAKPYALEAARAAREDALRRRGIAGRLVESSRMPGQFRVEYETDGHPRVCIIIPTRDQLELTRACVESIRSHTSYSNYEILLVDNDTGDQAARDWLEAVSIDDRVSVLPYPKPFNFAALNNYAVRHTSADFFVFLNNDTEIVTQGWLRALLGHAAQEHVGAVGCQLLFPGQTVIQHCGVVNLLPGPSHAFYGQSSSPVYAFGRNALDWNWAAVTGACMVVSRDKFEELGGFDEELGIGYNDVDLCFRFLKRGYYNVCRSEVRVVHHESVSRGHDALAKNKLERLGQELEYLNRKHPEFIGRDPFYNLNLTYHAGDFSLRNGIDGGAA